MITKDELYEYLYVADDEALEHLYSEARNKTH